MHNVLEDAVFVLCSSDKSFFLTSSVASTQRGGLDSQKMASDEPVDRLNAEGVGKPALRAPHEQEILEMAEDKQWKEWKRWKEVKKWKEWQDWKKQRPVENL